MAVQIVSGGAGAGKTTALLTEMITQSMQEPGRRFFVIVPEQATMETQRKLVSLHPRKSILNLEVTSLNRLACRVFEEVGVRQETMLEETGKTFLLERIALEQKQELPYLGRNLTRPEYLAEMKSLLSELMLYDISPEMLEEAVNKSGGNFHAKMADVLAVYRAFLKKLEGTYLTAEAVPDHFCTVAGKSEMLRGSVIALDGFTGFTPVQYRLLGALMPIVRDLYVTVTIPAERDPFAAYRSTELFAMGCEMAQALRRLAVSTGTELRPAWRIAQSEKSRAAMSPELRFLEMHLLRTRPGEYHSGQQRKSENLRKKEGAAADQNTCVNGTDKTGKHDIRVTEAANPREELEAAAREICRLVREEGMRYRDIAIVTGDLASYGIYAAEIMQLYDIPCFIDEKRRLLRNPLMEYLRAALETCADQYAHDSMFRMLKSGMTDFTADEIEHLENYALGTGLRGKKRWREPFRYPYKGEDPAELPLLEEVRRRVCELIDPLSEALARRGSTVREKSAALWEFCEKSHAEERIRAAEEHYRESGRADLAREYAQVLPYFCSFLDKLVSVLGDEPISMTDFRALLEAGFAEARVAIIPPGNDRVLIGDVERTRLPDVRVLIFAGVNEGLVPRVQSGGGLLTEADRGQLIDASVKLKPTAREAAYIDRFYLYTVLTKPSERLCLTYSRTNGKGEVRNPSYVIDLVQKMFSEICIEHPMEDVLSEHFPLPEKKSAGLAAVARGLSGLPERVPGNAWKELFLSLKYDPDYAAQAERLTAAAGRHRPADQIGRAAARALYGSVLVNSASRLESFCGCAFAHYLRYGLRLQERPEYLFTGLDFGTMMHRSLELFGRTLIGREVRSIDFSGEEVQKTLQSCLLQAVEEEGPSSVIRSTARDCYRIEKMQRLLQAAVTTLDGQLSAGDFVVNAVEEKFCGGEELAALRFRLAEDVEMTLTGKIDRIDTSEDGDATYVKIVDFKTGGTEFDPAKVYHGLQLQLLTYLNAAMELLKSRGKHPVPAGIFYQRVQDPLLDYVAEEEPTGLAARRMQKTMGSGMVLEDREVIRRFDREAEYAGKSRVIPVEYKKDGELGKRSKTLTSEEFSVMQKYANRKILQTGKAMMDGEAQISPYQYGQESACTYCAYRDVCLFDRRTDGDRCRNLAKMKPEEALSRMEQVCREEEQSGTDEMTKSGTGNPGEEKTLNTEAGRTDNVIRIDFGMSGQGWLEEEDE